MNIKYALLAALFLSAGAFASSEAELRQCINKAQSNADMPNAVRDCFLTYMNYSTTSVPIADGIVLKNFSHNNGYIVYNFQLSNLVFTPGSPPSEKAVKALKGWIDSEDVSRSQKIGYCEKLGQARDLFEDGAIVRYYDKNGLFITQKVIPASECGQS